MVGLGSTLTVGIGEEGAMDGAGVVGACRQEVVTMSMTRRQPRKRATRYCSPVLLHSGGGYTTTRASGQGCIHTTVPSGVQS
jgi:hypothetical protein